MDNVASNKAGWKHKLTGELFEYSTNFAYLVLFFGVFNWYRRLILDEYKIGYLHYGVSIIEALVLAKLIMIGELMHLGRRFEEKPLIVPAIYQSIVFSAFVALFSVLERTADGLLLGKGMMGGVQEIISSGFYELAAKCLIVFFAFIPFFAFRELEGTLGEGKLRRLLFRSRAPSGPEPPMS